MITLTLKSSSTQDTEDIGAICGKHGWPGLSIALKGGLAAGKTVFTRGFAEALGISDPITSPTYTLVQVYEGKIPLVHMDWYRIGSSEEALELGLDDFLDGKHICILEWPERAPLALPRDALELNIIITGPESRDLVFRMPQGEPWQTLGSALGEWPHKEHQ